LSKEKKKEPQKIIETEKPVFNYILIAAFSLLVCVFTTYKLSNDDDVFWHLATGKYIIQNFSIPSADVFGFATQGQKWIPFEWGWDLITYLIFNIGGFVSLSILRTALVLSIFLLIYLYLKKNNVNITVSALFSFLLLLGILVRLSVRPQLVSYLFLVLVISFLLNYKFFDKYRKSLIYILPVIFLLWANMHMGVNLGLAVFGLFILSESYNYLKTDKRNIKDEDKSKLKILLLAFGFSAFAMLINPNTYSTFIYTFRHTQMDMLEQINEWKSPFRSDTASNYNVKIYLFFLTTGILILFYSIRNKNYFPVLVYVFLGVYSAQAIRFITDFMIGIFIFWVLALSLLVDKIKFDKYLKNPAAKLIVSAGLLFIVFTAYDGTFYKKYLGNYFRDTGFGVNERFFPKSMFDFISGEGIDKIGKRPFNNLKIGGYFIWNFPESKNFIDSRNLNDSIYMLYKNIDLKRPGFENMIDNIGFDYFIYSTPYLTVNAGEIEKNIISYLSVNRDKWKLVYWDDRSFLFVKNIPQFSSVISKYEYKYISPYNFLYAKDYFNEKLISDYDGIAAEINRKLEQEPGGVFINTIAKTYKRK